MSTSQHAPPHVAGPVTASRRGHFWVGSDVSEQPHGTVPFARMFVAWEAPEHPTRPPIVLVHGGGGQGTDWMQTPDGRPGWSRLLVQDGWPVYVVDRPVHGRSYGHPDVVGPSGPQFPYEVGLGLFAPPPEGEGATPLSHLHDQWPGSRDPDSPLAHQLLAPTGSMLADLGASHRLDQARLAELLDLIGPSVVMTHSAGAPAGWLALDARPDLVLALVALEPFGPPFTDGHFGGLSWGLTDAPLTYDPPVTDAAQLRDGTTRRLPNLAGTPIAVCCGEASVFSLFDHEMVEHLTTAGCDAELLRLADNGVRGNGHAVMYERNHADALGVIRRWLDRTLEHP